MVDDAFSEREASAVADPYRAPAADLPRATATPVARIAVRAVEWTLGALLVFSGLAQCGLAASGIALSFVVDVDFPVSALVLLFANGLMLAAPGALLCAGRSWAAWFVLAFGLLHLGAGLPMTHVPLIVFGSLLTTFSIAILVLSAYVRRGRKRTVD